MIIQRSTIRDVGLSAGLLVIAGWLQVIDSRFLPMRLYVLSFLLFSAVCIFCIIATQRDLTYAISRNYLTAAWILLLAWLCVDLWVTDFVFLVNISMRVLWYLSYIPPLGLANTVLLFAVTMGALRKEEIPKIWYGTIVVSLVILTGIMTNDLQGGPLFRIDPGIPLFRHGNWSILAVVWVFIQFFATMIILYRKVPIRNVRRRFWAVLLVVPLAVVFFFIRRTQTTVPFVRIFQIYNLPETCTILTLIAFETGVRINTIRSNYNYEDFFTSSALSAAIADSSGVRYVTKNNRVAVTQEDMKEALQGEHRLDDDHYLCAADIHGGHVYWVRDIAPVNRLQEQLRETRDQIEQDNILIRAESTVRAREAQADEQNRLYRMMARSVETQLARIEQLLEDLQPEQPDFHEKLAEACVYKVFVKRYCNLQLLARDQEKLPVFELQNSLAESRTYLELKGAHTAYLLGGEGSYPAGSLEWAFYMYEQCVEADLLRLQAMEVKLRSEGGCLYLDAAARGPGMEQYAGKVCQAGEGAAAAGSSFSVTTEKDILRLSLSARKEVSP